MRRAIHIATLMFQCVFAAMCQPAATEQFTVSGEIYYPAFGALTDMAGPARARVLVRAPRRLIGGSPNAGEVAILLRRRAVGSSELILAANDGGEQAQNSSFVLTAQILGVSELGLDAEVLLSLHEVRCTGAIVRELQYEPGKTKLVRLVMRRTRAGRLQFVACEHLSTVEREPIRVK